MNDATITHSAGTINAPTSEYRAQRPSRSIRHQIINAEDVDVTFRPAGLRDGSFRLAFAEDVDAVAALDALSVPQTFTFASASRPALDMSFVIVDGTMPAIELGAAGESLLFVPFQEVAS